MCMKGKQKVPMKAGNYYCKKCLGTSNSKHEICKAKKLR